MKRRRIAYSAAEMAWLEMHRMLVISDYHEGFVARFGRKDVSPANLHGLRKRKGWKVGRDGSRYKGRRRVYNDMEIAFLKVRADWPRRDLYEKFQEIFGHADLSFHSFQSLCKREGLLTGRTGCFSKGHVPQNKGKKMPFNANSARTQFQKGQLPGNYLGPGHERICSKDGYVIMIVAERNPWTGAETRPVHKHRWIWERENGPIPEGHFLKCKDGDKTNTDPSNWELLPDSLKPLLNGRHGLAYDAAEPEVKPTVLAIAKLRHQKGRARRGGQ